MPLNRHIHLDLPGPRSTTGHCLQSSIAGTVSLPRKNRKEEFKELQEFKERSQERIGSGKVVWRGTALTHASTAGDFLSYRVHDREPREQAAPATYTSGDIFMRCLCSIGHQSNQTPPEFSGTGLAVVLARLHDIKSIMKHASVADLRNKFAQISKWIEAGEVVEITKRGRAFATLKSAKPKRRAVEWPDLEARLRSIWPEGVRGKPVSEIVDESRGEY